MKLREFLFVNRKSITEFAEEIGTSRNYMSMISLEKVHPSYELALKIEEKTHGKVKKETMLRKKRKYS